jgi:hypothetical protein
VNYVDQQLLRLADPATRANVFDQLALEQIVAAAYDADAMGVAGPFAAVFDELRLGVAASPLAAFEGTWSPVGGADKTEAHFRLTGLGDDGPPRVDAFWRGSVTARFALAGDPITSVVTTTPDARTIDAQVTFAEPRPVSAAAAPLPLAAVVLVRDAAGLSLAELLADSKSVRERLRAYGAEQPPDPVLRLRETLVVVWVVPEALFDDGDWPGGGAGTPAERRAARRIAAGTWLAREGIGLAATS